jgi:hypothetical protein
MATEGKLWTVMVWMAGDNDLEEYGGNDLKEMKAVGSTDALNILVQFDRMSDDKTRRYFLRAGTSLDADVVGELGETNTGDPAVAADFFTWGIQTYPAQHHVAVLWNHGSGIDETDVYKRAAARGLSVRRKAPRSATEIPRSHVRAMVTKRYRRSLFATTVDSALASRAIAYDDTSRDFLDNVELKRVLTQVKRRTRRKLDLVGFDACLMNMVEVAYQLKDSAAVMVGSEETEPGDGWPYDRVLADLAAKPAMTPQQLGGVIVQRYAESYRTDAVTQSALDLRQCRVVAKAVDGLGRALVTAIKAPAEYGAVSKALNATQRYEIRDFFDLYDLCANLKRLSRAAAVKAAAQAVMDAMAGTGGGFVLAEKHKGSALARSHGVSIYFPRGDASVAYPRLDFAKATHWDDFIAAYTGR